MSVAGGNVDKLHVYTLEEAERPLPFCRWRHE
jgi:hypothetical protein